MSRAAWPALPAEALPGEGVATVEVTRHAGMTQQRLADRVIDEQPVALVFNGVSHVVMMATPLDLEDFALGFALSEGLIHDLSELRDVETRASALGVEVHVEVSARAAASLRQQRRQLAGRTGCGLCGIDSLKAFHEGLPAADLPERARVGDDRLSPALIWRAFEQLPTGQALQADTGGCHAAAWSDLGGRLVIVREDVGRHNALDKLIGALARADGLGAPGLALVSSRASYEMVGKCVRTGIGALAAISAPTALAIDLARRHRMRLFGFCRQASAVEYA